MFGNVWNNTDARSASLHTSIIQYQRKPTSGKKLEKFCKIGESMDYLGNYMSFSNGKSSPERNDYDEYPVYGANGIIGYSDKYNANENTIIIGRVGAYCGSVHFSSRKCWVTDNAIIVKCNNNDELFWFFYLNSIGLNNHRTGSGQPLLNQSILKSIVVDVPSELDYRVSIGNDLFLYNQKIHLNTQTAQTLETIAQTIFKSWFVDFDPIHAKINAIENGEDPTLAAMQAISCKNPEELYRLQTENPQEYRELEKLANAFPSEIGEDGVPVGWEEEYLKDVCKIVYGKNLPKTKLQDTGYYVFGANGVIGYYDKFLYKKPQILIGCRGTVGQVSISYPYSFITNNSLVIEYEESKFDLPYIHQSLQHMDIKGVSSGSVQPQITIQNMSELKILVPPLEIYNTYINKVKEIYELRLSYFYENKKIEKIRDELLPRLLKGEI